MRTERVHRRIVGSAIEREVTMAVKLHRCGNQWVKIGGHPCWRVEQALIEMGIDYERAPGPWFGKRPVMLEHTGVRSYPAIEFEDGTWYRAESKDMAEAVRAGRLNEMHGKTPGAQSAA
jgi:hypothetical protein